MSRSDCRIVALLAGLAGLLLLTLHPARAMGTTAPRTSGTVTWIHDADTLEIAPLGKVRLLGVDAPEKSASSRDDQFLSLGTSGQQLRIIYKEGLAWCIRHVKGEQVTLSFDQTRRDRYGRLLAYVYLADGRLLNRVLLDQGLVIVYRRFPFRLKSEFLAAESTARERRVGLWRALPHVTPEKKQSNSLSKTTTPPLI